jgi:hypothetical protein
VRYEEKEQQMKLNVDLTRKDLARLVEGGSVNKRPTGTNAKAKQPIEVAVRNTKKKAGRK